LYQWRKGIAQWKVGKTLYLSVPFTWLLDEAERIAAQHKGKVIKGGPAYQCPQECEGFEPILFHNPCATFTTRGCPNRCGFCAVPKIEGEFKELPDFRPAPCVCDNNFLAASIPHIKHVVDKLKQFSVVDFNQALDARLFKGERIDLLCSLKGWKARFSFDGKGQEAHCKDAIDNCKRNGIKDITIYCLIGWNDTPELAIEKLELIRSWGALPFPMRYQPLNAKKRNEFILSTWTERKMRDVQRYYSKLNWWGGVTFDEYEDRGGSMELFAETT